MDYLAVQLSAGKTDDTSNVLLHKAQALLKKLLEEKLRALVGLLG